MSLSPRGDRRSMSMRILKSRLIYSNNEHAINSVARGRAERRLLRDVGRTARTATVACAKSKLLR